MAGVWLISLLLMYNFMTTSFRSYRPLRFDDRYLYPILMPSLILMGLFLSKLLVGECSPEGWQGTSLLGGNARFGLLLRKRS